MSVNLTDNSDEVTKTFEDAVERALEAIGQTAEGYAKDDCPVDTGRLRNSITYTTATRQSASSAKPDDYAKRSNPEKDSVYIGTNVEYAQSVEFGDKAKHKSGKAHFLRDAATQHSDEYKKIMESSLKAEM